jgi:CRISPR-associated protein Cmr2
MPTDCDKKALLSFMIGQVQPFIEAARTVRDLWTGSYLMSWLTATAMGPIIDKKEECGYGAFVTPHVDERNPMLRALRGGPPEGDGATLPSLPNRFSAEVPLALAAGLRDECLKACREEWRAICDAVHAELESRLPSLPRDWDKYWHRQVTSCLEMRCVYRPLGGVADDPKAWAKEWEQLGALMEMTRSVRHVPDYQANSADKRFPGKCSLLGTYEQMGPPEFDQSRAFWERLATEWKGLHGTRLRTSDRLCAVSLVKRFAWPAYFARTPDGKGGERPGKLGVHVHDLRYSDTATLAAALWLPDPEEFPDDPGEEPAEDAGSLDWRRLRRWSGQWLHWKRRNQEEDEKPCPQRVWDAIQARKRRHGAPPAYYALLHMDGDRMGELFKGAGPAGWGKGRRRYREITRLLTTFSLEKVRQIVKDHGGELIYAGGDDVLAVLPAATVVACARALRDAFRHPDCLTEAASISAGVAVVHHKEDLRFALQQARAAEKAAKRVGKEHGDPDAKDALALTVCRRSGEHTTAVLGWGQASLLTGLVADFRLGASDRWAYKLRAELPTLRDLPLESVRDEAVPEPARAEALLRPGRAEALRLVGRVEKAPAGFAGRVAALFDAYRDEMRGPARNWPADEILEGFVTLCQSASFLARGRE